MRRLSDNTSRVASVVGFVSLIGATVPASVASAQAATAQPVATNVAFAPVPFGVGEELTYRATLGGIRAGTARMRVDGIELVRGRPAYHLVFEIDGGIPLFRVRDRYESWIDVQTLASLRHHQRISEGRYKRTTTYEIYPEQAAYSKNGDSLQASVSNPLDDGSFIYAVRAAGIDVGETRRDDRYFRPDKNPVVLTGVRRDTISVRAGTFATTVVNPSIRTSGIFSEGGQAHVWFTDDEARYPVQVKAKFSKFNLVLTLESIERGQDPRDATILAANEPDAVKR